MCGLFGYIGDDVKKFNRHKLNILGMENVERGKHSCGVSVDGELYKGVKHESLFHDFMIDTSYPNPKKYPIVIGHTRHATMGAHDEKNAHPFRFDFPKKQFAIGAHNGSLRNDRALAEKYKIDPKNKIDSQILLEILAGGNSEVLFEYRGYAAVLMFSTKTKDSLWVFKGASKETVNGGMKEERPLFFYQEGPNSMYISSLEDSLYRICEDDDDMQNVYQFKSNFLYRIEKGVIKDRYEIDREDSTRRVRTAVTVNNVPVRDRRATSSGCSISNRSSANGNSSSRQETLELGRSSNIREATSSNGSGTVKAVRAGSSYKDNNIFYEKTVFNTVEQLIFYENLRYKEGIANPKLVTGICIFLKEIGFVSIAKVEEDLPHVLKSYFYYDEGSGKTVEFGDIREYPLYYIYKGVLMENRLDYVNSMGQLSGNGNKEIDFRDLSQMSRYPIIDINKLKENKKVYPNSADIVLNNSFAEGTYRPIGSFKIYEFDFGNLKSNLLKSTINLPEGDSFLSVFEDGMFVDFSGTESTKDLEEEVNEVDEENDFETNLQNELLNFNESDINRIIAYSIEVRDHLENLQNELSSISDQKSVVVEMFNDYIDDSIAKFAPIRTAIMEITDITTK